MNTKSYTAFEIMHNWGTAQQICTWSLDICMGKQSVWGICRKLQQNHRLLHYYTWKHQVIIKYVLCLLVYYIARKKSQLTLAIIFTPWILVKTFLAPVWQINVSWTFYIKQQKQFFIIYYTFWSLFTCIVGICAKGL